MPYAQYIGARYVPKFYENPDDGSNNWKSGQEYEPLTIVTYQGNSYTSKKPVTQNVGNPADNPAYWAETGNYNASITALQNAVSALSGVVDNIKYNVEGVLFHFPALHYAVDGGGNVLSDGVGNCCIIEHNEKFYMVDCFTAYQMSTYGLPYLNALGVDEIECVYITHYHGDHCDGLIPLLNSAITVKKVILAPAPDMTRTSFWTAAHDDPSPNYNNVISALTSAGVPYDYADPNPVDLNDGLKVTALNTYVTPYYAMTTERPAGNTTNDSDAGVYADYNNLSTVYCFELGSQKAYFLSDINYTAQQNILPYIDKAALITIPHHDHDTFVDRDVMNKFNPDVSVAQDTANETLGNVYALIKRMAGKYLNAVGSEALSTFGANIIIQMSSAGGEVIVGENHTGYYDFMLTPGIELDWKLAENPLYTDQYEVLDADTLEPGTTHRLGGSSTNTPIAGYGCTIITMGSDYGIKFQVCIISEAEARTFYRSAGANNPYTAWIPFNLYSEGFAIPSGADLNAYTTPGVYNCPNAAVAATLSNTPISVSGFRLEVFRVASGIRQRVTNNGNTIQIHERGNASMQGFGNWTQLH